MNILNFVKDKSELQVYFDIKNNRVISKVIGKMQLTQPLKESEIPEYLEYLKSQGWIQK